MWASGRDEALGDPDSREKGRRCGPPSDAVAVVL
jgi:hypothetical protein